MIGNLSGLHLLIILAVVVLLFGATKLPALAKSVGQSMRIFKGEMKAMEEHKSDSSSSSEVPPSSENKPASES